MAFDFSKALLGALGGAGTGLALGTAVPGIGNAVGAIGGGLIGGLASSGLFDAPQDPSKQVQNPIDQGQIQQAYQQANQGLSQQQAFLNALQGQNALANQSQVYNQLQGVASGTGPNPALAQFQQATGQNIANQAALMAGQRGASANPALIARMAAQQGGALQQQAAQQAATLQANQQLAAIQAAGNLANQQAAQLGQAQQGYNQAALGLQQNLLGGQGQYNNVAAQQQAQQNQYNQQVQGGLMSGVGSALQLALKDKDKKDQVSIQQPTQAESAPVNMSGVQFASHGGMISDQQRYSQQASAQAWFQSRTSGKDPGDQIVHGKTPFTADAAKQLWKNSKAAVAINTSKMADGGKVPGKAEVKGDSLKNDKVPAMLSPGEIVLPRSVVNSKDPEKAAAKFVAAILAKDGLKKKS